MSETYYVKTFGGLEITNDNVTVNIVELFGKQLVNLLQVLLFHSEKPVQKDELIDILWPESKNPSSALKFSIFRLRSELNEIDFFKDKDTFNKLGYKTKINTHTTSCINLFLDIYFYSEYRLIYC